MFSDITPLETIAVANTWQQVMVNLEVENFVGISVVDTSGNNRRSMIWCGRFGDLIDVDQNPGNAAGYLTEHANIKIRRQGSTLLIRASTLVGTPKVRGWYL